MEPTLLKSHRTLLASRHRVQLPHCVQGNCSRPPSAIDLAVLSNTPGAAALLPLNAGQCLIMSHDDLFPLLSYRCAVSACACSRAPTCPL